MTEKHIRARDLIGKVVDAHSHIGLNIAAYARLEFPYCQSIEGLYYRHQVNSVDYGVVFPFSPGLYFDIPTMCREGRMVPASDPLSAFPYERENRMLFVEVFRLCGEYANRFLPFVCVDPVRDVAGQLSVLRDLETEFPIYGIKVSPVLCQAKVTGLLEEGEAFLDFARERDLPLLIHVTVHPEEEFSQVEAAFQVIERHPELRFCLAHCAGLSRRFLGRADAAPNVWVDTSALKIQVQLANENNPIVASADDRYDWDYRDHTAIMRELASHFRHTIVWGSDSPAYAYICRRLQSPGRYAEFRLKANYEDEKAALDALDPSARERVCSTNTSAFLFGASACCPSREEASDA